ncbi:hypothetical protein [Sphingomonas sp. CFBP 8760]|uniref:hypothetical protein n=1 Tax=Sphingomonas sp. CFBP 8760 TaxID=2775282 RepID=UPI00177FE951|nr:hypothetical protein [Sphingomonas sp. CFBP 8760]MBD8549007.1 hypothetical protein [Sphingomonas sp. CFBP 8760]
MTEHRNLHVYGGQTKLVRESIQADYKRDTRQGHIMDLMGLAALLYLMRSWDWPDRFAALAAVMLLLGGLRTFIDNSNRNWWLHRLNYDEQERYELREAELTHEADRVWAERDEEVRRHENEWRRDAVD